jgi:DGQHR domain-containing protein
VAIVLRVLRNSIVQANVEYPFFIGSAEASSLAQIALAPSFSPNTQHQEIANNVLAPPVKNWQRPLNQEKWVAIKEKFSQAEEIMPNPVLLAVDKSTKVRVSQQKLMSGHHTEIYEIEIETDEGPPLWILDGQHRIKGLSESKNRKVPVPFVLLFDEGGVAYTPAMFAKVFAQVTTEAVPLNKLHQEWLQFVFRLGDRYMDDVSGARSSDYLAMEVVASLCATQKLDGQANPWFDKIQFNPGSDTPARPAAEEGFAYSASELQSILVKNYFQSPKAGVNVLTTSELVGHLGNAILALKKVCVGKGTENAFVGDHDHIQKYFQEGFLAGVLSRLQSDDPPQDWIGFLTDLNFEKTDWDVSAWTKTTGGNAGNVSKKVAGAVFKEVFCYGLPNGVENIPDFLQGGEAYLNVEVADCNPVTGKKVGTSRGQEYPVSGTKSLSLDSARLVKIRASSSNIGQLKIIDKARPFDLSLGAAAFKKGIVLDSARLPLTLAIESEHYGGTMNTLNLTFKK